MADVDGLVFSGGTEVVWSARKKYNVGVALNDDCRSCAALQTQSKDECG
jgi:hypothetical protein